MVVLRKLAVPACGRNDMCSNLRGHGAIAETCRDGLRRNVVYQGRHNPSGVVHDIHRHDVVRIASNVGAVGVGCRGRAHPRRLHIRGIEGG